jgi:hypothetical protein
MFKRILSVLVVLVLLGLLALECFARFYLGLGDPMLTVTHPRIEYLCKPNQSVQRFHHLIEVNAYSMRSPDFDRHKAEDEFRVLCFGDSILHGGNLIDQYDLATSGLMRQLEQALPTKRITVGNVSAKSWGPGNWRAYAEEFGFFDADAVVLVISSHDYLDMPNFRPLSAANYPSRKPWSALVEGATVYFPRYLPRFLKVSHVDDAMASGVSIHQIQELCRRDLSSFINLVQSQGIDPIILQHPESNECDDGALSPDGQTITAIIEQHGIHPVSLMPYYENTGAGVYLDGIHLNKAGQERLSLALFDALKHSL